MTEPRTAEAGSAVAWKAIQLLGGRGIALLRLLILARLLLPDDFGLLSIALATLGVVAAVTDLGMVPALVQHPRLASEHYHAAWTVSVLRGLAIAVAIALAAPWIAGLFAEPRAAPVIRLLALRPLLDGAVSIRMAELTRRLNFRALAFISLPAVAVETLVAIVLALRWGVWALVAGILAGGATSVVMSYVMAPHRPRLCFDFDAVRPLVRYGRWIFVTNLVAVAGSSVLQLVISRRLGSASLGLYYLAMRLAFLPSEVASEVVGSVAFPLYARLQDDLQRAARAFEAVLTGMIAMLAPVFALLIALTPSLVDQVLGERWTGAAPVLRILALVGLIGLFGDAVVPLLKGLGRPDRVVVLEAVQSLLMIALVGWLAARYDLLGAASAWLPAVVASQLVAAWLVWHLPIRSLTRLHRTVPPILGFSLLGAGVALAVDRILPGLGGLLAAGLAGLVVIALSLWSCDRGMGLGLAGDLARAFPRLRIPGYSATGTKVAPNGPD